MYSRQNPGEMFAESLATLTLKSTTGSDRVDKYVLGVIKHA